jgi:hypothetical protein
MAKSPLPSFDKPRILLVDIDPDSVTALRDAGFNVTVGSLGTPTVVKPSVDLLAVSFDSVSLKGLEEQEIVVVNTRRPPSVNQSITRPNKGLSGVFQAGNLGFIDPRPLAMRHVRGECERILEHGGIFILIMSSEYEITYFDGVQRDFDVRADKQFELSNWSLLTEVNRLQNEDRNGTEITYAAPLLERASEGASFSCAFSVRNSSSFDWMALATNKFGEPVAGLIRPSQGPGAILLLPQMPKLGLILKEILEDWCVQWSPNLFPHHAGQRWMHEPPYELPDVSARHQ